MACFPAGNIYLHPQEKATHPHGNHKDRAPHSTPSPLLTTDSPAYFPEPSPTPGTVLTEGLQGGVSWPQSRKPWPGAGRSTDSHGRDKGPLKPTTSNLAGCLSQEVRDPSFSVPKILPLLYHLEDEHLPAMSPQCKRGPPLAQESCIFWGPGPFSTDPV